MKKNILMLGILLILGGFAYYLVNNDRDDVAKTIDDYDFSYRDFAIKNIDDIAKIVVVNRTKGVFTFKKHNDAWFVNDSFVANKMSVNNMLSVFQRVKIDYVPTEAAQKNAMKGMMLNGIKVEIYDKNGNALKKYFVGDSPQNSIGTYFVMDGYSKPLVMTLPGFKGNLRVRFSYSLNEWRDRTVIDETPEKIEKIEIKYYIDKDAYFELERKNDKFEIHPAFEDEKKITKPLDQKFANSYLVSFTKKIAEGIIADKEFIENILNQQLLAELVIERKNGTKKSLKIFMSPSFDKESLPDNKGIYKYFNNKVHRYFAQDYKGDVYQIQYIVFDDVLIPYQSFFKK